MFVSSYKLFIFRWYFLIFADEINTVFTINYAEFSLHLLLDESTEKTDNTQLVIFISDIHDQFEVFEQLPSLLSNAQSNNRQRSILAWVVIHCNGNQTMRPLLYAISTLSESFQQCSTCQWTQADGHAAFHVQIELMILVTMVKFVWLIKPSSKEETPLCFRCFCFPGCSCWSTYTNGAKWWRYFLYWFLFAYFVKMTD